MCKRVLMCAQDMSGWKLEDLCDQLVSELQDKTDNLENVDIPQEKKDDIAVNNHTIMNSLEDIKKIQKRTMEI